MQALFDPLQLTSLGLFGHWALHWTVGELSTLLKGTTVVVVGGRESASHIVTNCQWPALKDYGFFWQPHGLTNVTMWWCTYAHISTAPASCCIAPWVMTHSTNPLALYPTRGWFFTPGGKSNIWFWLEGLSCTPPPVPLGDFQSCWQGQNLSLTHTHANLHSAPFRRV